MKQKGQVVGVQFLRGLAALAVVLDHAAGTVASPKYYSDDRFSYFYSGVSGVDVFFLISGFIITIVSLDKNWNPKTSIRDFALRRFWRIVPLMWLAILSFLVFKLVGRGAVDFWSFLRAFVLFPVGEMEPANIWTLRHELIFYAVFAATMLGPKGFRPFLILWGLSPFAMLLIDHSELADKVFYATNVEFCTGVLLGLVWCKRPVSIRLPVHPLFACCVAMAAAMTLARYINHDFHSILDMIAMAACIAPLLWLAICAECPDGRLTSLGGLLGDASYSIYLFHPHVLTIGGTLAAGWLPGTLPTLVFLTLVTLSVLVGVAIHKALESPLLSLLHRRRSNL